MPSLYLHDLLYDDMGQIPAGRIKSNEQFALYNPFFYDLAQTKLKILPEWDMPGINLNWLYGKGLQNEDRLIFGVEALEPGVFLQFADKFSHGHSITEEQAARLTLLGHPTLAFRGKDMPNGKMDESFVTSENYNGQLGGELFYEHGAWWVDDCSGRYGGHNLPESDQSNRSMRLYFEKVKSIFKRSADIDVHYKL